MTIMMIKFIWAPHKNNYRIHTSFLYLFCHQHTCTYTHTNMQPHACTHTHTQTNRYTDLNAQRQRRWQVLIFTKNISKRTEYRFCHEHNTITIGKNITMLIQREHRSFHLDSTIACSTLSSCGCLSFARWVGPFFNISRIAARSFLGSLSNVGTFLKNTNNDTS